MLPSPTAMAAGVWPGSPSLRELAPVSPSKAVLLPGTGAQPRLPVVPASSALHLGSKPQASSPGTGAGSQQHERLLEDSSQGTGRSAGELAVGCTMLSLQGLAGPEP